MDSYKVRAQEKNTNSTLLIIDDDENVLISLKKIFEKLNCNIITKNNAIQGLDVLEKKSIDVIISDMTMQEMSGGDFFSLVSKKYPNTFRILLTNYSDIESIVNLINLGLISQYIEKPWDDIKLTNLVRNAFDAVKSKKKIYI